MGLIRTGLGIILILIPEPATTATGIALVAYDLLDDGDD